jgi:hypothetical protein
MTALLPNNYTVVTAQGSQWSVVVTVYNEDGSLANLTGKIFEFIVRSTASSAASIFSVTSTASTGNGTILVSTAASAVTVVVNAAATGLLSGGGGNYTLWMDQGLSDATALMTGVFLAQAVPAP